MVRERREELRVSPKGTAIIRTGTATVQARVDNLSRGGMSATTWTTTPEGWLGTTVDITLRIDDRESAWVELTARVLRITANTIAVAFDAAPASFALIIDEILSASDRNDRVLSIVLVDATLKRRTGMSEAFRAVGCEVLDVSTPLEAIVRLGESVFEPDLIAIADSSPSTVSDELRRFVTSRHPETALVTIGDAEVPGVVVRHWLSSLDPDADLGQRIRRLLTRVV